MMKTFVVLLSFCCLRSARGLCEDVAGFTDENGEACSFYAQFASCRENQLSDLGLMRVLAACASTCGTCVRAADYCEIGVGGDQLDVAVRVANFEFVDQAPITGPCSWTDTPEGMAQTTNSWGNAPGDNTLMGCMAILKPNGQFVEYTDFILEVEARHDDNDGFGFVFGVDAADRNKYYQVHHINDRWPDPPADNVPGPHLKIKKRNGLDCLPEMDASNNCYDLLGYVAAVNNAPIESYPNGSLSSMGYIPEPYAPQYDNFVHNNFDNRRAKLTLVVHNKEARVYFKSENNLLVGAWAQLGDDYVGGQIGLFTYAHQPIVTSFKVVDLSPTANAMSNSCALEGATCDPLLGLCLGGPTSAPTATPTVSPTYQEPCNGLPRAPAADFCPNPVGGALTTYDVFDLAAWEFIDQPLITSPCAWAVTAAGLEQSTNAWGNSPGDNTLMGCIALAGADDVYTDFIAEFEAIHDDNDGWGFVFGYKGETDHYMAITINDVWPQPAADGVGGPFVKIKKANGKPCLGNMNMSNNCYDLIAFTDEDGFNDMDSVPRLHEYEYTHSYSTGARFQPHKITLIVKNGEARVLYKSADFTATSSPENSLRQGNRYQAAMTMDLGADYSGGRVGLMTYAHQLNVTSFKITDISDDSNLPTDYCGGDKGTYCDAGVSGLCLAVAANDVCEGAVGGVDVDMATLDAFTFVEDPYLRENCSWTIGSRGVLRQNSNAARALGDWVAFGCNAIVEDQELTDFVVEATMDHDDNDGVGFNFGWKSVDDHFRVHKINDIWPTPAADFVTGPHLKLVRRVVGVPCPVPPAEINTTNNCYDTIAFIDSYGPSHAGLPTDAVTPAGVCGYAQSYVNYQPAAAVDDQRMVLIVKDNEMRAFFESPFSRRVVAVQAFDLSPWDYSGGKVGFFTFAHQANFVTLNIAPLVGQCAVTQFCNDIGVCAPRSGRCLGAPTMSPTFFPTVAPTTAPTPNVAANDYCQGAVSASAKTVVDTSDIAQFDLVEHELLTENCVWSAAADGMTQSSSAWGNTPGDNALMGCMAIFNGATFTDFIAEFDVTHLDNDGWGIVFGYKAINDHYLGVAMNDRWPQAAADGIQGPFLKIKKHNGKPTLPNMDASNVNFDTLSHLDGLGFNREAMEGATGTGIPKEYEATYPYRRGDTFEDTKIVLIVTGQEARLYYPTPDRMLDQAVNSLRQSNKITATWTFDLKGYSGGQIGFFTYAHEATFSNFTVTDLSDPSAITAYCDGFATCDNQRGDASTGLCHAVPVSDVCEGPVGDFVTVVDTTDLSAFEYFEDPLVTDGPCVWELGTSGNIRQTSNADAVNSNLVQGCSANVKNLTVTDFIMQVDFDNDDNDVAGLNFGWKSHEDYFRMHKHNDNWPNPSADLLPGPIMKVLRKMPDVPCDIFDPDYTNTCYQTLSYIDLQGAFHNDMPAGMVAPAEYSRVYLPYSQRDAKRVTVIVRDNALRVMYEDVENEKHVSNFVFDLTPFGYAGGAVGLFTAAHQAEFSNFRIAELSGPNAATTFCNGGLCDDRTGLCLTTPTQNPTSRVSDVAASDICPGPVGGDTLTVDVTDISLFTIVDQDPITEPCLWTADANGIRQNTNAWGNSPGDNTLMGCVALLTGATRTDFIAEITALHDDDDGWGFVFGYDSSKHYIALATNDKWPDPAADGVMGPFIKIKKSNSRPCLGQMNMSNNCYDTLSYTDGSRFNVDGEELLDIAGEYHRRYPYAVDTVWPTTKMTLIVKGREARVMFKPADVDVGTPVNNLRQMQSYATAMTFDLGDDYNGGLIGLFTYAHQLTVTNFTVTDLATALPTAYCNGEALCDTSKGLCTKVAVSDVCMDPIGPNVDVVDTTDLGAWDFVEDPFLDSACDWSIVDVGRGAHLGQLSNANRAGVDYTLLGCNALYKGKDGDYTDFLLQYDVDNYDNDGIGFVFGWKSEKDHFKAHKVNDIWPNPAADSVVGPSMKVKRRLGDRSCQPQPMDESNNCYETVTYIDSDGPFHQAMPADAIAPWQYSPVYQDYEIGSGTPEAHTRFALLVKNNELRLMFNAPSVPDKMVATFAFDLAQYDYQGGRIGLFVWAHQAQFWHIRVANLAGPNVPADYCDGVGTCNNATGLCDY